MSYYFTFDADGVLNGRYFTGVNGEDIPGDAVEVSEELFSRSINESDGMWKLDPKTGNIEKQPLPDPEPYAPQLVTRAQGKAALITSGLWPDVLAYVEAMTDPTEKALAEVALHDTTHWRRDSPTMQAISTAIDIASEQVDELFIKASQIEL